MSARGTRYMPLDFLRGLSIFGMVLSAIQPHGVMPGWMYHVQNPPPTHDLDMSVPGIGWVDMVFPIFIFCMGVGQVIIAYVTRPSNRQENNLPKEQE